MTLDEVCARRQEGEDLRVWWQSRMSVDVLRPNILTDMREFSECIFVVRNHIHQDIAYLLAPSPPPYPEAYKRIFSLCAERSCAIRNRCREFLARCEPEHQPRGDTLQIRANLIQIEHMLQRLRNEMDATLYNAYLQGCSLDEEWIFGIEAFLHSQYNGIEQILDRMEGGFFLNEDGPH